MKRQKEIALFILIGLLSFALSAQSIAHSKPKSISLGEITATPTLRSFSPFETESPDVRAIIALTQAYFEARYRGLSTLRLEGFETFLASSPEAARFWKSESAKLSVDLKHAELNQLRYVKYEFSLEYVSVQIDPKAQRATVVLEEKGKVVYELSARLDPQNPIVSSHSLRHIIQLVKESGRWKILSDTYTDYLWRIMQETGITPEQLLATMRPAPLPSRIKQQGSFSCPLAPDESAHDYNREGAVNYALKYAESPNNLNYYYFSADEQLGGDCTNFVSQAIYEGGKASMSIPPTPEQGIGGTRWYYFDVNNRARAWTYVDGLYDFITHPYAWSEGPEGCEVSIDQITIGDVIQYETNGDNTWDHSVVVVEIQNGIPYVASHSPNFRKNLIPPFHTLISALSMLNVWTLLVPVVSKPTVSLPPITMIPLRLLNLMDQLLGIPSRTMSCLDASPMLIS